jgi:thiosulfate/3-mercaptopyruvate sulfurtransferase
MPAEQLETLLGQMGIGNGTPVVAYDGSGGVYAARFWWVLDRHGKPDVRVLNGGFTKWLVEDRPVSNRPGQAAQATFRAITHEAGTCDLPYLLANRERQDVVVWDVRSRGEYTGETRRQNKRGGHIPGAVNLEWTNLVTADESRAWKPADELRQLLTQRGITPEKEVLVH